MTSRKKTGWGAQAFTSAAHLEQQTCEKRYLVMFVVSIDWTAQRGVYRLRIRSEPTFKVDVHLKHSVAVDWPNATTESFEACLYQQTYKLCRMVEQAQQHAEEQAALLKRA